MLCRATATRSRLAHKAQHKVSAFGARRWTLVRSSSTSSRFRVVQHVIPCAHTREYPHATSGGDDTPLSLAVNQYLPLSNTKAKPGDVTIIGAHANGFPKVSIAILIPSSLIEAEAVV